MGVSHQSAVDERIYAFPQKSGRIQVHFIYRRRTNDVQIGAASDL